jgi:hypothetical protein
MFLRSNVLKEVGGFDEELGVGAETPFQSGEDTELLLRAIKKGFQIQYLPPPYSHAAVTRARLYGAGMGRVLRKHGERPLWNSLGGALVALLQGDLGLARIRVARAFGRLQGWRMRPDHKRGSPCRTGAKTLSATDTALGKDL